MSIFTKTYLQDVRRQHKLKFRLHGFSSYKDGTFRIVVKDKEGKLHSKPLDKKDRINFHKLTTTQHRNLVKKYFK